MPLRAWVIATAGVLGACVFFAWFFDIAVERALLLAPVFVISFGLIAGLGLIFWRAAAQSLRRRS